ncbi:MAG: hypothetical protein V7655_10780 [Aequorivita antarctica]
MYQLAFMDDKKLMYVSAVSFPEDILNAHQELYTILSNKKGRDYYGISFADSKGKIQYKAATSLHFEDEAASLGLKTYLLKKGIYKYITIPTYKDDIAAIERAFKILLLNPKTTPLGDFLEGYYNDDEMYDTDSMIISELSVL